MGTAAERAVKEDEFVFPDAWRRHLHPRRGGVPGSGVKIDKKAPAATDRVVAAARAQWLDAAMLNAANDEQVVEDVRRALEGEVTAAGAAALAVAAVPERDGNLARFVDAWILRHGIAFAAVAAVKVGDVDARPRERVQLTMEGIGHTTDAKFALLRRMRTVLAECSADQYAAAIAELREARNCRNCFENCRAATAYLVPTETEWVSEACRGCGDLDRAGDFARRDLLVRSLSKNEHVELLGNSALIYAYTPEMDIWTTLIDGLGAAAAPLFVKCLSSEMPRPVIRAVGSILAQIPSDEAFRLIADRLEDPRLGGALREASARFPVRAVRVLADIATGPDAKSAENAREQLQRHVRTHRDVAQSAAAAVASASAAAGLPERSGALVLELLRREPLKPIAPDALLPTLLVSPPWTDPVGSGPHTAPKIVAGLEALPRTRVVWGDEELAALAGMNVDGNPRWDYARMAANVTRWLKSGEFEYNGHNIAINLFKSGPVEEHRHLVRRWRPEIEWNITYELWPILRRFDIDAIPALVHVARRLGPVKSEGLLLPIVDLEAARLAAHWLLRLKTGRQAAEEWFGRHGADAALLLIPDAVGKPGKARAAAEDALRHLAATTVPDLHDVAASRYGADAAEAVGTVLAVDPAEMLASIPPALPDWLDPAALPQVLLRGGEQALPGNATSNLLSVLALSTAQQPYSGLSVVFEALDRPSVTEFGRQVHAAWRAAGRPAKQAWILPALSLVGGDETAEPVAAEDS